MAQIEHLWTDARSFLDEEGDVRPNADLPSGYIAEPSEIEDEELIIDEAAIQQARPSKQSRSHRGRGGRSHEEISGRDVGRMIDQALSRATEELGRPLTDDEQAEIARNIEWEARHGNQ